MPRSKPYTPYRNISRHRMRRNNSMAIAPQSYIWKQPEQVQRSEHDERRFATKIILAILILIIGGCLYMTRQSLSSGEVLKGVLR